MGNSTSSNKAAAANLKKNGILAEHLVGMLEMIKKISQATTLSHATSLVVEEACKMMGCDRATVFVVDKINEQLVIKHSSNDDALEQYRAAEIAAAYGGLEYQGTGTDAAGSTLDASAFGTASGCACISFCYL